jgi:hypothetical protein
LFCFIASTIFTVPPKLTSIVSWRFFFVNGGGLSQQDESPHQTL